MTVWRRLGNMWWFGNWRKCRELVYSVVLRLRRAQRFVLCLIAYCAFMNGLEQ